MGGDVLKLNKKFTKKVNCAVKQVNKNGLLLSDGQYFISAYLTPEAYAAFSKSS